MYIDTLYVEWLIRFVWVISDEQVFNFPDFVIDVELQFCFVGCFNVVIDDRCQFFFYLFVVAGNLVPVVKFNLVVLLFGVRRVSFVLSVKFVVLFLVDKFFGDLID